MSYFSSLRPKLGQNAVDNSDVMFNPQQPHSFGDIDFGPGTPTINSGPSYVAPAQPRSYWQRLVLNTGIVYLGGGLQHDTLARNFHQHAELAP